jgi:hypothetical protein
MPSRPLVPRVLDDLRAPDRPVRVFQTGGEKWGKNPYCSRETGSRFYTQMFISGASQYGPGTANGTPGDF